MFSMLTNHLRHNISRTATELAIYYEFALNHPGAAFRYTSDRSELALLLAKF
jgi:hypothetical protein